MRINDTDAALVPGMRRGLGESGDPNQAASDLLRAMVPTWPPCARSTCPTWNESGSAPAPQRAGVTVRAARSGRADHPLGRALGEAGDDVIVGAAGEWAHDVGIPAKSGVSGGIMAAIPDYFGLGVYSPDLDRHGNSVRGVAVCRELSTRFGLHVFADPSESRFGRIAQPG